MKKTKSQAYSFTKFTEKPKEVEACQFFRHNHPDTPGVKKFKVTRSDSSEMIIYYTTLFEDIFIEVDEGDWVYLDEQGSYQTADSEWFFKHFTHKEGEN